MERRIGKKDIFLLAAVLAAAILIWIGYQATHQEQGAQVQVTVDGTVYGTYELKPANQKTQVIEITNQNKEVTNVLTIEDGRARMTDADCPDQLCIHQGAISTAGGTIVCLPNKVVAEIIGDADDEAFDTIAQ